VQVLGPRHSRGTVPSCLGRQGYSFNGKNCLVGWRWQCKSESLHWIVSSIFQRADVANADGTPAWRTTCHSGRCLVLVAKMSSGSMLSVEARLDQECVPTLSRGNSRSDARYGRDSGHDRCVSGVLHGYDGYFEQEIEERALDMSKLFWHEPGGLRVLNPLQLPGDEAGPTHAGFCTREDRAVSPA
jgi:hypothetical protein